MSYKLIGIVCVIVACGGAGFMMAGQYISQIRMLADMIIVLDNGMVVDVGDHSTLLERSPIYREVYDSQKKGGEE